MFNVSFQYYNQDGTMIHNGLDRFSIRANSEFNIGRLSIGENFAISREQNHGNMGNQDEQSVIGQIIKMQPIIPVYDIDGCFAGAKANTLGNGSNPVAAAYKRKDNTGTYNRVLGNFYASLEIIDGLKLKSSFGVNVTSSLYKGFNFPTPENSEPTMVWSLDEDYNTSLEWTWTNTLNYVKTFGNNHNINALLGYEAIDSKRNWLNAGMAGFVSTDQAAWYISDALGDPSTKTVYSYGNLWSLTFSSES
ncbi:MAG: hypothetical protein R2751_08170 [Bacteroidales bacterium]